ncbi:Rv3654c family TadE-like protein [Sphaerimonospora mesophila]|uniref:Rv3654c family TadE-like protein n=1 Tax=Sphaerimonospora mesophila TaxID=37483 RepID=UPI0006E27DEC
MTEMTEVGTALRAERGSATVWAVAMMALICVAALVVVQIGAAGVVRHRAQSAADLSALAAASWMFAEPGRACERARTVAMANGARLRSCSLSDGVAAVSVIVAITLPLTGSRTVTGTARAGPVSAAARSIAMRSRPLGQYVQERITGLGSARGRTHSFGRRAGGSAGRSAAVTTVSRLAAAAVYVPLVVTSALVVGAAPASAGDGEILSPADGEVISSTGPVTVSAKTDWYQVKMALYVEGPSVPRQKIGSAGGNQTITGSFDPGNAPNGAFTVTLAGEITKKTYTTSTFTLSRPPEAPSGVDVRLKDESTVVVRWARGNEPDLTSYEVTSKEAGRTASVDVAAACEGSFCQASLPLSGRTVGRNVDVSVRAFRSDGRGGTIRSSLSGTAFVGVPPAKPTPPPSPSPKPDERALGRERTSAPREDTTARLPSTASPPTTVPPNAVPKSSDGPKNERRSPDARRSGGDQSEPEAVPREEPAPQATDLVAAGARSSGSRSGGLNYGIYIVVAVALLLIGAYMGAWFHRRRAVAVSGEPVTAAGPGTAHAPSEAAARGIPPGPVPPGPVAHDPVAHDSPTADDPVGPGPGPGPGSGPVGPGPDSAGLGPSPVGPDSARLDPAGPGPIAPGPAVLGRNAFETAALRSAGVDQRPGSVTGPPGGVVLSNSGGAPRDPLLPRPYVLRGDALGERPRQPEPDYWAADEEDGGDPAYPARSSRDP